MRVSVIVTVLNEAQSLPTLLDSLEQQSTPPDEIVLVDGGSVDGSWELLQQHEGNLPLRMFQEPGTTIAQGRNSAIAEATGEIIAVTDAGVQLPLRWLEELLRPFESEETQAVAGFFRAAPTTLFELTLGATTLPALEEINPASFLPSSRSVAFTKAAWEAAGGYPDWLDYGEDLVFDLRLRSLGVRFVWAPLAEARYRPRTSLWAFFRQYYHYARGDGKADLWFKAAPDPLRLVSSRLAAFLGSLRRAVAVGTVGGRRCGLLLPALPQAVALAWRASLAQAAGRLRAGSRA